MRARQFAVIYAWYNIRLQPAPRVCVIEDGGAPVRAEFVVSGATRVEPFVAAAAAVDTPFYARAVVVA